MSDITLDKVKQFESLVIKCLLSKYGSNLPQNKIELLNSIFTTGNLALIMSI